MKSLQLTKLEKSWVLYDIGNSAFTLMISTLFRIYFDVIASGAGLSDTTYLAYWGYAASISTLIVGLSAPVLGALADRQGLKKKIFLLSVGVGAIGCAVLGFIASWVAFLVVFVVAKVGFSTSLVFCDAMLPEVTTEERMDSVSSQGYAYGYIGSCIPFVVCLALVLGAPMMGLDSMFAMAIAFIIVAIWWVLFALPLARAYQEKPSYATVQNPVKESVMGLVQTFKSMASQKHILYFLIAFFFYIDGVYTIIDMATAYGTALGLDSTGLLLALLVTQIVAFPCAIIFGRLAAKYPTSKLIRVCIVAYAGICVFAVFLATQWQFWVLAVCVGMFQGGIQALSRSYFGKIIPPEQSGEYFGIYDICGKGASFMGTTLVASMTQLTNNSSVGVGTLIIVFIVGFFFFSKADKHRAVYDSAQQ